MSNTVVKVSFLPGTSINQAAVEAVELARRLGTLVEMTFNDVYLLVGANAEPEAVVARFWERCEQRSERGHDVSEGPTIKTDFEGLKRMAKEFTEAMPTLDQAGLENGMKAFALAYLGCEFTDDLIGRANEAAGAPALLRIVHSAYQQHLWALLGGSTVTKQQGSEQ